MDKPATGLFSANSWVKSLTQPQGQKQPHRWVAPYFTQCWVVFIPAVYLIYLVI